MWGFIINTKAMLKNILRQFLFIAIILTAVFTVSHFIYAWSEPVANPPAGNAPAPLNVSNIGQAKVGGLILNTGGAAVGLVVDKGNVGIGELNPGAKLDVAGVTQTDYLVVNQQNGSGEGGEIRLDGSAGNTTWQIDTVGGYIRFHHDGLSSFEVANNGVGRLGQGAAGLLYFGNRGYYKIGRAHV